MASWARMILYAFRSSGPLLDHLSLHRPKFTPYIFLGFFLGLKLPLQLGVFYRMQDFAENRPWLVPHFEQILPAKQGWRPNLLPRRRRQCAANKSVRLKPPVAGKAIEPVQLQVLLKSQHSHKALQRRSPHLFDVLKPHVVGYQRRDLLHFFVREPQPPGNVPSHPHPNVDMPVETDAITRLLSRFEGRRLTYIVQKNTPCQCWRGPSRQLLDHQPRVDPHIALRV